VATSLYFEDHSGRHKVRTRTPARTPTLSQLPKPSAQFPYEFKQIPWYYKSFSKYLEKNINIYKCLQTVEQLLVENGCTIPDSNLIIVDEDLKVVSADSKPLLFFFKRGLQRPFGIDPSPNGYEALKDFVQAYPPRNLPIPMQDITGILRTLRIESITSVSGRLQATRTRRRHSRRLQRGLCFRQRLGMLGTKPTLLLWL
jgi:hypothetical protein